MPWRDFRCRYWTVLLASAALITGAIAPRAAAQAARPAPTGAAERDYEVEAQPLIAALASFARVSGVDIFYEANLAAGRTSAAIRGRHSPQTALRQLLAGTGLSARFTGPKAAIIYATAAPPPRQATAHAALPQLRLDPAEVRAPVTTIGTPDRSGYQRYAQAAQLELHRLLDRDPQLRGRVFTLKIALVVAPSGRIERAELLRGSGDVARDAHVRTSLLGQTLPPPPPDLRGALHFELATARLGSGD